MIAIELFFNDFEEKPKARVSTAKRSEPLNIEFEHARTPADDFHDQVETLYRIPRPFRPRGEVRFSPSQITKCARELYYYNTDAPIDDDIVITPWKQRIPRNGEGCHEVTQKDYLEMHRKLTNSGYDVLFEMIGAEVTAKKTFNVSGVDVVISGRCDGILEDKKGVRYIWEKKTKDKYTNFKKVNEPTEANKGQATCYSLLFDIPRTIFEYESLQKPQWTKDLEQDLRHFYFEVTPEMEESLLSKLSTIVLSIQANTPPPRELDKCTFCQYKQQCRKDGR